MVASYPRCSFIALSRPNNQHLAHLLMIIYPPVTQNLMRIRIISNHGRCRTSKSFSNASEIQSCSQWYDYVSLLIITGFLIACLQSGLLRPCPTPGLIRLLRSHRSTVAQLRTSVHYSGPGRTHTLPLSVTLCIRLNPVVTTLPRPPCCTVSSPCSVCIFYLVVFSPDLTYFHRT